MTSDASWDAYAEVQGLPRPNPRSLPGAIGLFRGCLCPWGSGAAERGFCPNGGCSSWRLAPQGHSQRRQARLCVPKSGRGPAARAPEGVSWG